MAAPPTLWRDLRRFTPARVALGRVGNGLPTDAHLAFQAAHAAARDAVHAELDVAALQADLAAHAIPSRVVSSACPDRATYLLRPDLGRALDPDDAAALTAMPAAGRIAFLLCDGLSSVAVQRHAVGVLARARPVLEPDGAVVIACQGRVALGDDVGAALQARVIVVLIGERPGLSSPDSLGVYVTWQPRRGRTDAERNCLSNVRPAGLSLDAAADKLIWLVREMGRLGVSGVALKDAAPLTYDRSTSVLST